MSLTIDGQANSITSSVGGVNIPATVGTLSVGPSGSYMNVTSSGTNIGPSGSYMTANSTGIGIGTNNPQTALHLKTNGGAIALIESNTNYDGNIRVKNTGAYYTIGMLGSPGSTSLSFYDNNAGATRLAIDSSGRVTMPYQPSFCASKSDSEQTTSGTIIFNDVSNPGRHNVGNHYSTSTGTFTCPVAGRYVFMCSIHATNGTNRVDVRLRINGSDAPGGFALNNIDSYTQATGCAVLNVAANDAITIYNNSAGVWPDAGLTYFSGYLVG